MDDKPKKKVDKVKLQQEEAANLVRAKLRKLYGQEPVSLKLDEHKVTAKKEPQSKEPSAKEEIKEVKKISQEHRPMSKHQQFLNKLSQSGMSLKEIQAAWHKYYEQLSDKGKHEVWNEFYAEHQRRRQKAQSDAAGRAEVKSENTASRQTGPSIQDLGKPQSKTEPLIGKPIKAKSESIKKDILKRISSRSKKNDKKSSHWHSLVFGLTTGLITMLILLFSFFNERFITPFIRPNHNVGATPIIVDPNRTDNVGPEPKIIIPKINIEAPVVFNEPSIDEKAVQKALERGVVHYGITPNPGENGNSVIVGHSSSNILNSGKYKFAFLLLKSLEKDDTFYVHKDGKRYVYKVYNKFITDPDDVSVLDPPKNRKAITTLITCDPPGFSTNRLIIQAEQIFPDPDKNKESSADPSVRSAPAQLPSDSPTLWSRLTDWF
ncbi:MAG TPA: sortase [Candidatus Saccharimonadales bacterium]|nr:sortase [Candidatus Saccharimonadales bacterium]